MQGLIETLWSERSFSALLVTHDIEEAVALADRVVLMENGAVALDLPVDLPRPRRRSDPDFATIEGRILEHVLLVKPCYGAASRSNKLDRHHRDRQMTCKKTYKHEA